MNTILKYILRRFLALIATFLVITAVMYACLMMFSPEDRAQLFVTIHDNPRMTGLAERLTELTVQRYHLRDPFPVQYANWLLNLFKGNWGYSPVLNNDVFNVITRLAPATIELTLYSLICFIPLGIITGLLAGWRKNGRYDLAFRFSAYVATSLPLFIMAFVMLGVFYISLYWFAPGRLGTQQTLLVHSSTFTTYTGLLTVDGILNGRLDITLDAVRHLMLPVVTLSLANWATLGRVTRISVIEEKEKDYIMAAHARGMPRHRILWRHVLLNALPPGLTSSALSAASLITGVYIIELIYNYNGMSSLLFTSSGFIPDVAAVMGFTVYSITGTLLVMFVLDVLRALIDPRLREEIIGS
jgi:ABC-type dipeptide/oligopeptide/nickel transport system permease component